MDGWKDNRKEEWIDGRITGRKNGQMEGKQEGRMDGWKDDCIKNVNRLSGHFEKALQENQVEVNYDCWVSLERYRITGQINKSILLEGSVYWDLSPWN